MIQKKPLNKAITYKGPLEMKYLGMIDEKTGSKCFKEDEVILRNVSLNLLLPKQEGIRGCFDQDQGLRKEGIGATERRGGLIMRKKGV